MATLVQLATARPGTVRDANGAPCTAARPDSYPLTARCDRCADDVRCADGTADWTHPRTRRTPCEVRTVEPSGLVYQDGPYGPRQVGEVHRTRAGRFYVVMAGRRVAERLVTFGQARDIAVAWRPEPGDEADLLAKLLDPSLR